MIKMSSYNAIPLRNSVSFKQTIELDGYAFDDKRKVQKLEELAEMAKEAPPSAAKSFVVVSTLMTASALTGAAASRRAFDFLHKLNAFKNITPKVPAALNALSTRVKNVNMADASKFKKAVVNSAKAVFESLDDLAKNGVEEKLKKVASKKTNKIKSLRSIVRKANPGVQYTQEQMAKAVDELITKNPEYKKVFNDFQKEANEILGTNLSRKATVASAATVMGVGALKEASKDLDNNGVPDCVEYGRAKRESSQKLTAALIDCALDTI